MSDEVSLSIETMPALKLGFCQLDEESISVINNYVDKNAENLDDHSNKVIVISCIDNLVKGAAGQAVQNMNIMCGFYEDEGLKQLAIYP